MKVVDAIGAQLDWMVAKCEGQALLDPHNNEWEFCWNLLGDNSGDYYSPSTNWAQGGPIIERERISIRQWTNVPIVHAYMPHDDAPWASDGTSPLIAAMRCFCCSKLGDEVDVPEELM